MKRGTLEVEAVRCACSLRDAVISGLVSVSVGGDPGLTRLFKDFRRLTGGKLTREEFADVFAHSVVYGLFAAAARHGVAPSRSEARSCLPRITGPLGELLTFALKEEPPDYLERPMVDLIRIVSAWNTTAGGEAATCNPAGPDDPAARLYEAFLAADNPGERLKRGVYYTPDPVVSYIVRSLHLLLKERFLLPEGLASGRVTLVDPAAGTMVFLCAAVEEAVKEFGASQGGKGCGEFIRSRILPHFHAFELTPAAWAVGLLKMAVLLDELGCSPVEIGDISFHLMNSLDTTESEADRLPYLASGEVESLEWEDRVLVILGNPPYSGHSVNRGEWIRRELAAYRQIDGRPLGERNPKWLQDDYVKFLRLAQMEIERAGRGMVGMITNHSYLDAPTFRGMRRSLMDTFDEIMVLDLHGSSLKGEQCEDGTRDENVFPIRQGAAIGFFIKTGDGNRTRVRHAELRGARGKKFRFLDGETAITTRWRDVTPGPGFYPFVPRDERDAGRYRAFPSVTDLFLRCSVGVITARDRLTVHRSRDGMWNTVRTFASMEPEEAREAFGLGPDAQDWKVRWARDDLRSSGPTPDRIVPIMYRPFDIRYTYYTGRSRGFICRPRHDIMRHMLTGRNTALVTCRQISRGPWAHAFVTDTIADDSLVSNRTRERGYVFPLYLSLRGDGRNCSPERDERARPLTTNLNPSILRVLTQTYARTPSPEDVLHYVYAVLNAGAYRARYAEFLRMDFPRIPFPDDSGTFFAMAELGRGLVDLHLLRSDELAQPEVRLHGAGDASVGRNRREGFLYNRESERVHINHNRFFAPVPQKLWNHVIGGYEVCRKWLWDRRGRMLSSAENLTYSRMLTALALTMVLTGKIDDLYHNVDLAPLTFEI